MECKGDATLSASVKTFHRNGVGCNSPALCLAAIAMTTRGKMESWGGGQDGHVGQHNLTLPQEVRFMLRYMTAEFQGFSGTFLWSISVRTVFLLYIDLDRSQINTCKFNHTNAASLALLSSVSLNSKDPRTFFFTLSTRKVLLELNSYL